MKKYKLKMIGEGEFSEIDFDLYNEILGSDNVGKLYDNEDYPGDYIDKSETVENCPIQIDKMIDYLQTMKEEIGATYVEINYDVDHIAYNMYAYKVEEIKKEIRKEIYFEKNKKLINKYYKIYKKLSHKELCKKLNISIKTLRKLINIFDLPKPYLYGINTELYLNNYKSYNSNKNMAEFLNISVIQLNNYINHYNLPLIKL